MPKISEREMQKNKKRQKRTRGMEAIVNYSESVRAQ